MDEDKFLKSIMNRFNCGKEMAETIYKSSEKSGELDKIKYMVGIERNENK